MWANSKLVAAGHDPISVDNMADSMKDGVVLCNLLEALTGKRIRGVDRKPRNPLQYSANMVALWNFMEKEGIETNGITSRDVMKGNEKIVLALLWKYIMNYDLEDPEGAQDALLEWVQPRTEKYYDVQNFTTSWKNGIAFLALFDSIKPGVIDMDAIKAQEDDVDQIEPRLAQAFDLLEEHLGVSKFLEVNDLMVAKPDKKSVMTYVATVRNAAGRHEEAMKKAAADSNAAHMGKGEELFQQGVAKFVQASSDDESHLDDVIADALPELEDCDGTQEEYDRILEESCDKLKQASGRHDDAIEKFKAAKEEFETCDDGTEGATEGAEKSASKVTEVESHKRGLEEKLKDRLKDAIKNAKGKRKLHDANEDLEEAITDCGQTLQDALTEAYEKIDKSRNEQQRIDACNEAKDKVRGKTKVFSEVKEGFEEAERLLDDGDDKDEAVVKAEQCDTLADQLLETLQRSLDDALSSVGDQDDLSDGDLLTIYHAFSVEIEGLLEAKEVADPGINREKGMARSRLDDISGLLRKLKSKEAGLRKAMHAALDKELDEQALP